MSKQTILTQNIITDMSQSISIFSGRGTASSNELPLVLIPKSSGICNWWVTIPDGCHCIMHEWGKDIGEVLPGFKFQPPWVKVAFLVSKQSAAYNAPVKNCPTSDNVMVQVDITLMFSIVDPRKFVYTIGAIKFNELLKSATEESIRGLVRGTQHDKVYELRGSRCSEFLTDLNKKFTHFGVSFSDATITNVSLPADLAQTLENETTFDSKMKEEQSAHQHKLKFINQKAEIEMKKLKAENQIKLEDEYAKKERVIIQKGLKEIEAQKNKELAIIQAEEQAQVLKYKAETEFKHAKIFGEKEAQSMILKANGDAEAAKIECLQQCKSREMVSQNQVLVAENKAKEIRLEAEAEGKAAKLLKEKREHDIKCQKLKVLQSLAKSGKIVISGETGDELLKNLTGLENL